MKKRLYNIPLDIIDRKEYFELLEKYLQSGETHIISFVNAHCFNVAQKNKAYRNVLHTFSLVLNDGIGIEIGCRINGFKPRENMNGTDLIPETIIYAHSHGKKVFLLGGEEGIAVKAKTKLQEMNPELIVAGWHSGFFSEEQEEEVIQKINSSNAEVLVVGMGVPKQELWAAEHKDKLKNVNILIPGGAILDFLAGKYKRAPRIIQKIGLEWVVRLIQEPKRLAKRYIWGNIIYMYRIIAYKIAGFK